MAAHLRFTAAKALHQYARLAALLREDVAPFVADDEGVSEVTDAGGKRAPKGSLSRK